MFGHKTSAIAKTVGVSSFFDIYNGFRKLAMESLKTILRTTLLLLLVMVSYNSFRFGRRKFGIDHDHQYCDREEYR